MQSLLLPGIPSPHRTSFTRHRFDTDLSRFSLSLNLSSPRHSPPTPGSPYLSPPMSGSPPPPTQSQPSPRTQSHRRVRAGSPSLSAVTTFARTAAGQEAQLSALIGVEERQRFEDPGPSRTSAPLEHGGGVTEGASGTSTSRASILAGALVPQDPSTVLQRPASSRRPKAHVASACVNCRNKHLRCDQSRPCRRCVQTGKEASCEDVQHRKRGRPPLRPGDSPTTPFSAAPRPQPSLVTGPHPPRGDDPSSRSGRSLRPIRPGTGVQSPISSDMGSGRTPQRSWVQGSPSSSIATTSPTWSARRYSASATSVPPPSPWHQPPFMSPTAHTSGDVARSYLQPTSYPPSTYFLQQSPYPQHSTAPFPTFPASTQGPIPPPSLEMASTTASYRPELTLAPLQPGVPEQARRHPGQIHPEQLQEHPHTLQRLTSSASERASTRRLRPREETEEEEDQSEPTSKRRRGMGIGELLER